MTIDEHQLEPAFDFTTNESSIVLHKDSASVCINGNTYTGDGEARLDLLPRAGIHLYGYFKGVIAKDAMEAHIGQREITSFSINGRKIEGFRVSSSGDLPSQEFNIKWCPKSEPIIGVGDGLTEMKRVVFHVFNFVDLLGTRHSTEQNGTSIHAIQHVDLICDEWKVDLKSLLSTPQNIKALKEEGGYRLTHIGGIQRPGGTPIVGNDVDKCLHALRYALSLAKGGWCEPICAVGFDASGNRVWESWSSPREPWHNPFCWFDPHSELQLATMFSSFMKIWADDEWREALHEVIYWYLNANFSSRGIDAGIILTQAAIERLSFQFAVKDRRLVTVEGFKNLWASDKFRLLFSSLKIPLDIPTETPELQDLAHNQKMKWLDAPQALTEIRNSLVHPEHKKRGQLGSAYYEAWNLGLWYLEMGILAICGYSGTYGNRLKQRWVGQVENVPWS
jgi:hypothetical protein